MERTCVQLAEKIRALGFAIYEVELFLDTHPDDCRALETREEYIGKQTEMICEYEKCCGPWIMTAADVTGTERWEWIDGPWPWEYSCN